MILIVGLGNPGTKFKNTRHNIGFLILDYFKRNKNFSNWKQSKKFQAKISQGKIGRQKIILAKPQTYMNNSGQSVFLLTKSYKLKANHLIVVHDDLDISFGQIKISKSRSNAGHKGVQSIINEIDGKNFIRFRIGIFPVRDGTRSILNRTDFVLGKFTKSEQKILKRIKKRASNALEMAIKKGIEKARQQLAAGRVNNE